MPNSSVIIGQTDAEESCQSWTSLILVEEIDNAILNTRPVWCQLACVYFLYLEFVVYSGGVYAYS
jgi:hypothetical protein